DSIHVMPAIDTTNTKRPPFSPDPAKSDLCLVIVAHTGPYSRPVCAPVQKGSRADWRHSLCCRAARVIGACLRNDNRYSLVESHYTLAVGSPSPETGDTVSVVPVLF